MDQPLVKRYRSLVVLFFVTSFRAVLTQTTVSRCGSEELSDFNFTDVTTSSANISWYEPTSNWIANLSSIVNYNISYVGRYRGVKRIDDEVSVPADEPRWQAVTGLSPWPTQFLVCLKINYMENGSLVTVNGENGCATLCTKLDHFDYFAIAAMSSGGMLILCLLFSFACAAKFKDPYEMSTEEITEMNRAKKMNARAHKRHNKVKNAFI